MACCCKPCNTNKSVVSCLGRCDLPKHKCLGQDVAKAGPVPKHMGWHYTAKDSPQHQLRCGWRPGHIACPVLRKIEQHNCSRSGECCGPVCDQPPCSPKPCSRPCPQPSGQKPCPKLTSCCIGPKCVAASAFQGPPTPCSNPPSCTQPLIRIIRHAGQYQICTKPSNISNAPSGPYPLKYVLNTDKNEDFTAKGKYSVEAKFNDYHFDYTSSQNSFVLDFTPPDQKCYKPCPKRSTLCMSPCM